MSGSKSQSGKDSKAAPAFLFDFDGTLIDSVYQHVVAWHEALLKAGIELSVWRVHRRIGMSGGLLVNALSRETNRRLTEQEAAQLQQWHAEAYLRQLEQVRPLPGARDLLGCLTNLGVKWAIATSGRMRTAGPNLTVLGVGSDVPIITRDKVARAKPDPDVFLAAAKLLKVPITSSVVVGDSVWDLLAARRQEFHRKITSLASQDRNKEVDGCRAQLAWIRGIEGPIDNFNRGIACRIDQLGHFRLFRQLLDVAEIPIEVWNPDSVHVAPYLCCATPYNDGLR